jgi:hypothetical protein
MTAPHRAPPPPEAAGPGTDSLDGSVTYGVEGPRAVVPRQRDPDELAREHALARDGCTRCAELPADLVAALRQALASAKAAGRTAI